MKKMMVLIGNYGSGKSELALNFAFAAAARGERTELLDLDMVNTYFRLTERGKQVEMKEIRLVSPNFANSGIETLSLPATGKTIRPGSAGGTCGTACEDTRPILEDDIILSGSPRMPRTWPDTGCMARIRNMIRAVRRGMAVSLLASL